MNPAKAFVLFVVGLAACYLFADMAQLFGGPDYRWNVVGVAGALVGAFALLTGSLILASKREKTKSSGYDLMPPSQREN